MNPLQTILAAGESERIDDDGEAVALELLPGLTSGELESFAATLPFALPDAVRELVLHCRGIEGSVADVVDFTGRDLDYEQREIFPTGLPIASDGFGNFWVADLSPDSTDLAPIWFACHDAPVVLYQSPSLAHFLAELFRASQPPHESLVDDVHEDRLFEVWRTNPGVRSRAECLDGTDEELRRFARELDDAWQIVDLRNAQIGQGFSWGRYGPRTPVRRFGMRAVFAYRRPAGFWSRLFRS